MFLRKQIVKNIKFLLNMVFFKFVRGQHLFPLFCLFISANGLSEGLKDKLECELTQCKVNGIDKKYQLEADTRTCDVLYETGPETMNSFNRKFLKQLIWVKMSTPL